MGGESVGEINCRRGGQRPVKRGSGSEAETQESYPMEDSWPNQVVALLLRVSGEW